MTREEAIQILQDMIVRFVPIDQYGDYDDPEPYDKAIDIAIEALSADALLKQEIDFHKEVSRIEAEKVVDLEHKLADMVSVVRCKDCKHYEFADNRAFGIPVKYCDWFGFKDVDDDDFCSRGERKDE